MDSILKLVAPDLYIAGWNAVKKSMDQHRDQPNVMLWPCAFSGITVIANRKTIVHRDSGGWPACYDLLLAGGNYGIGTLDVPDLNAKFVYNPGTVIAISGKVLRHSIEEWDGGERLCLAHFMRNNVHNRLNVMQTQWPRFQDYTGCMSSGFLHRWAQAASTPNGMK